VQREREGKEEGHAGQMSRKPEREAQKTKDGAMSGTGVGWSMGLGYRQQSQSALRVPLHACPVQPGHLSPST
jgi:hypothetical protein